MLLISTLLLFAAPLPEGLIIGHRGFAWNDPQNPWPENSLLSVEAAQAAGAEGVEIDLIRSEDGVLVLRHDDLLNRRSPQGLPKTDCLGRVSRSDWKEMKDCNVLSDAPDGFSAPLNRLEELVALPGLFLVLDVKDDLFRIKPEAAIKAIAELVKGQEQRVVLMLYHPKSIVLAKQLGVRACLKQHHREGDPELMLEAVLRAGAWGSCPYSRLLDEALVEVYREAGVAQIPYLLNRHVSTGFRKHVQSLLRFEVTGMITDFISESLEERQRSMR